MSAAYLVMGVLNDYVCPFVNKSAMIIFIKRLVCVTFFGGLCLGAGLATAESTALRSVVVFAVQAQAPAPSQPQTLSAADREKIQRVITLQNRAFQRNDEAVAFSYATPGARRFFGTPRAFMEMVRASYSALYRNTSHEFLEAAVIDGVVVQPLKILTKDGEIIVALYTVELQADKEWRVGSCELAPSTLEAI